MCHKRKRLEILERDQYKCVWCGVGQIYNNKPLTLQIDHIDGNRKNNTNQNLRSLCPNCHSQTDTYTFNKTKSTFDNKLKTYLEKMSKEEIEKFFLDHFYDEIVDITGTSLRTLKKYIKENNIIPKHKVIKQKKLFDIEKEELEKLIQVYSITEIGKMYDVSDGPVRKRLKQYNIKIDRQTTKNKLGRIIREKHKQMCYKKNNNYHVREDAKKVIVWDENTKRELYFPSIKDAARHLPICESSVEKLVNGKAHSIKGFSIIK
jgi:hypothetical protein